MNTLLYQSPVRFDAKEHKYILPTANGEKRLHGITGTLIRRAFPDKYNNVDEETLRKAAQKGAELHQDIELFDTFGGEATDERVKLYDEWKKNNNYTTIANEYLVSDEERYASSIDIVLTDEEGNIILVDVKTTYSLDKDATALQLSIYKQWFEVQNPDLHVVKIIALWLPNKDHSICEAHELSVWPMSTIAEVFEAEDKDTPFERTLPEDIQDEIEYYGELQAEIAIYQALAEEAKRKITEYMQSNARTQVKHKDFVVSFIPAKTTKKFDAKAFKETEPAEWNKYMKESVSAASLRIINNKKEE